jgi:hypothetical protein
METNGLADDGSKAKNVYIEGKIYKMENKC